MTEVASAYVTILPSARGFGRRLSGEVNPAADRAGADAGRRMGDRMGGVLGGSLKKAIAGAGAAVAAVGVGSFFKDAIGQASDLNESSTKLNAIFGKSAEQVQKFAAGGAKALGQTKLAVLDASATFGTFGKAAGLSGKDLAGFSTQFAGLSTDLASFYNTSPEQAVEAIGAALRGEAEPMRQYGVLLDDATMRQQALKMGLIKTTKQALTPQQKVLAAQAVIMKQTKDAQGDFARTSGGLANQQRILAAQWSDMKTNIGSALLPVVTKFVTFLNSGLGPGIKKVAGYFKPAIDTVKLFIGAITGKGADVEVPWMDKVIDAGAKIRTAFDVTSAKVKAFIQQFKDGEGAGGKFRTFLENVVTVAKSVGTVLLQAADHVKDFVVGFKDGEGAGGKFRDILTAIGDAAMKAGKWLAEHSDAVKSVTAAVLGGIVAFKVITGVVKAFTVVQAALNVVMALNPITLVVVAIAALAAGLIYAYKTSDRFRYLVDSAFSAVKIGALTLARIAVSAFQLWANGWMTAVGVIISGAAKAFGWMPGIGPKLKTAAEKFDTFKTDANTALDKVKNNLEVNIKTEIAKQQARELAEYFRQQDFTITPTVRTNMEYVGGGKVAPAKREHGGPVKAGTPYIVGEKRPELFVPNASGRIIPRVPASGVAAGSGTEIRVGTVVAHDYDDFVRQMESKSRLAALGAI